jgi:hypothetical protein
MRIRTLILIIALTSALAAGVLAGNTQGAAEPVAPPPPEVTVAEVLMREVHDWTEFTGRLESVQNVEVRPRVSGYVESGPSEERCWRPRRSAPGPQRSGTSTACPRREPRDSPRSMLRR